MHPPEPFVAATARRANEDVLVGVVGIFGAIEVVGTVSGTSDAYRGDVRLGSGSGRLYLLANGPPMHRRFLVAAVIELGTAMGLLLGPVAFVGIWSYLGWLALR